MEEARGTVVATEPDDPPLYDPAELIGCASADVRIPFDIREVLARLLDGSRFEEFKPLYGDKLVCGWGSICGYPVGVLGNNGILFSEESEKGAQFIQLANRSDTPLVFLQNITGFMVGRKYETGGIAKDRSFTTTFSFVRNFRSVSSSRFFCVMRATRARAAPACGPQVRRR